MHGRAAASEVIREAVLAIKTPTPLAVLADTIHAFSTAALVMAGPFVQAERRRTASNLGR